MPRAYVHRVTPEFFATLRMPIEAGRTFEDTELTLSSPSVIVSRAVVDRFWPGQDPVGKRIKLGGPAATAPWLTIVGVVPEVKYRALPANPTRDPDLYFPAVDRSPQGLVIRTAIDPVTITDATRAAIRGAHPALVVYGVSTLEALASAQTAPSRFTAWVLGLFAAAALLLSVVGIYGVMSYLVAQRTREFGIRLALGATRGQVVRAVLRQGATLVAIGAGLGVLGAVAGAKSIEGLLFNVSVIDWSGAMGAATLVVVALLACVVPAIRATRVDPVVALRAE
jgi:hypothetical protein